MEYFGSLGFGASGEWRATLSINGEWEVIIDDCLLEALRGLYDLLKSGATAGFVAGHHVSVSKGLKTTVELPYGQKLVLLMATLKETGNVTWRFRSTFLKGDK